MGKIFQILIVLFAFFPDILCAQSATFSVSGKVTNSATGEPLPSASVYISHSTRGVQTSPDGSFLIAGLSEGKYDLIVSYLGFETQVYPFVIDHKDVTVSFALKQVVKKLEDVVIRGNNDVWNKRFAIFRQAFLGSDRNAKNTEIVNKEILQLHEDPVTNNLTAQCKGLLVIMNKALGYRINYLLQDFIYNKKTGYLHYLGFPVFQQLEPNGRRQERRWENNRKEAYRFSLLRFYRVLGQRALTEQGYITGQLIPKKQGLTVIALQGQITRANNFDITLFNTKYLDTLFWPDVPYDSLITSLPDNQYSIHFNGMLSVDATYAVGVPHGSGEYKPGVKFSVITIKKPVLIHENGLPDDPSDIICYGYWMNMRIANLLPFDYKSEK